MTSQTIFRLPPPRFCTILCGGFDKEMLEDRKIKRKRDMEDGDDEEATMPASTKRARK